MATSLDSIFQLAIEKNNPEAVKFLLEYTVVDPSINNTAITTAVKNGFLGIVKVLLTDGRINPAFNDNYILSLAIDKNYLEIVKLLLDDPLVDPSDNHGAALILAVKTDKLSTVSLLLADARVDPTAQNNRAIKIAVEQNNVEMATLLYKDARVVTMLDSNHVLRNKVIQFIAIKPPVIILSKEAILTSIITQMEQLLKAMKDYLSLPSE